ncbi:MAG: hypothetical protein ACLFSO_07425 [Halanaerobium sp.]
MVEKALTVELLSNAGWYLSLNNRNLNSKVMIKKSQESDSAWHNLNSTTAKYSGEIGEEKISFDLKFILDSDSRAAVNNLALDLNYSIEPTL